MTASTPHWFLLGAGNMGTLAAWYLTRAGHEVTVLRPHDKDNLRKRLFLNGQAHDFPLPVANPHSLCQPISHLLVACKTPYTREAVAPVLPWLTSKTQVLRFQNGLGSLDGLLPDNTRCWGAVTTGAVKGRADHHEVVAENATWMGSGQPPAWFPALQQHWPNLAWQTDLQPRQWQKLVVNAVINPLTAFYDVPNGELIYNTALRQQAEALCREADAVLTALDTHWPGESFDTVMAVAHATAGNTSSMRADRQAGAITEIDAINGWLLHQASQLNMALPAHDTLTRAVKRLAGC